MISLWFQFDYFFNNFNFKISSVLKFSNGGIVLVEKKIWYVFFFQGEASPGLSDGDGQRSPQDRTKTHGRLDHQQRQVHHKRANKRTHGQT
jgi:hypothetical protein